VGAADVLHGASAARQAGTARAVLEEVCGVEVIDVEQAEVVDARPGRDEQAENGELFERSPVAVERPVERPPLSPADLFHAAGERLADLLGRDGGDIAPAAASLALRVELSSGGQRGEGRPAVKPGRQLE